MPKHMRRKFQCTDCGEGVMRDETVDREMRMKHEGAVHAVHVKQMPALKCSACGELQFNNDSDVAALRALREHLQLLQPGEIKLNREALELTQEALAAGLGCASESISRWETGSIVQSRAYDRSLRVFFRFPEVRHYLLQVLTADRASANHPGPLGEDIYANVPRSWAGLGSAAGHGRFASLSDAIEASSPGSEALAHDTGWAGYRSLSRVEEVIPPSSPADTTVEYAVAA